MLTQTTITGIRALMAIARAPGGDAERAPVETVAEAIGASVTYLGKVHTLLARAGLLRTFRGAAGGVELGRAPEEISLLEIVEACQGRIRGGYCVETGHLNRVCGLHRALHDLEESMVASLSRHTLADLVAKPEPSASLLGKVPCVSLGGRDPR